MNIHALKTLLLLCLTTHSIINLSFLRKKIIKMDRIDGKCKSLRNPAIYLRNIKIAQIKRMYVVSGNVVIARPVKNDMKLVLSLQRCRDKDSPDSCENYQPIHVNHMCDILYTKNKPWSPFLDTVQPPMRCPLTKGLLTATNGTFDGDTLAALPIEGWYWKIRPKLYDMVTNQTLFCIYVEAQIVPV